MNKSKITLAIQKAGRLTQGSIDFLRRAGLDFDVSKQRLYSSCRNFPLEILYIRDDDIGQYVEAGTVDLGIVGQNVLYEERPKVKKLLNLRFGFCSLIIAVPRKSDIEDIKGLKCKKIATSYPNSTKRFFKEKSISLTIMPISGAAEVIPTLGITSAIADLTATGSTLALNDLRVIAKIYDSEAVLIANRTLTKSEKDSQPIKQLLTRFKAVLSARNYKYVVMNVPQRSLPKLRKFIGVRPCFYLKSDPPEDLSRRWISIQSVIKEDVFWETVERLKNLGASGITVLPIEKVIV